jgi:hypothetical protein
LDKTTNTWVDGCVIENSNGAGLNAWVCKYPKITNTSVQNTLSNGFFIGNCQNAILINVKSTNSHDDGLEFANYSSLVAHWGAYARNVTILKSGSRGISVTGHSHVEVNGFNIDGTASSGVLVCTDKTYNTRVPENVRITNGTILNAGTITPLKGNQFGIEIIDVKSVAVSAVTTTGSANRGLSVWATFGQVTLKDVSVYDNRKDAGVNIRGQTIDIDMLRVINSPSYGIYIGNCGTVNARRLEAVNTSRAFTLRRAIWMENNVKLNLQNMHVIDNQAAATGYVVGAYGSAQAGSITGITSDIKAATLQVDTRLSPLVTVVK